MILVNGIRCDKLSTAVATVRVHPDKYEENFDAMVAFLGMYIHKRAPTPSVKIAFVGQNIPAKWKRTALPMALLRERLS